MRPRVDLRSEGGFTLLEAIAAMAVLFVGMAGALTVMDRAAGAQAGAKLREQGVLLQREIVEAARSLKYAELGPGSTVPRLQALPGLADASSAPGWQVRRRGIVYTVAAGACTVDDPRDSTGPHDTTTYCRSGFGTTSPATCSTALGSSGDIRGTGTASGSAVGDCGLDTNRDGEVDALGGAPSGAGTDANPNDFKRIVVLVRWRLGGGSRYVLQSTTLPWPGASDGVTVTAMTVSPSSAGAGTTQVAATATTSARAQTVAWSVDGEPADPARMSGAGQSWSFTWALGSVTPRGTGATPALTEVVDGSYVVSARAIDLGNIPGPERAETVVVSRRAPFSVPGQVLRNDGRSVEVAWTPLRERDIVSYRVYRRSGTSTALVCTVQDATACRDPAPPSGTVEYWVRGVDATQEGDDPATRVSTTFGSAVPGPPRNVGGTRSGSTVTLTWAAPLSGGAARYRVYRDGVALGELLGETGTLNFTDAQAGTSSRDYYVSAVSAAGAESSPFGPVHR